MNSNSTEDYLDSLLRSIQQKEESVSETEILEPVEEPQILETESFAEEAISENTNITEELNVQDISLIDPNRPMSAEEIELMFAATQPVENPEQTEAVIEDISLEEKLSIEDITVEDLQIEELPVEDLPIENFPVEDMSVEEMPEIEELFEAEELPVDEEFSIAEELSASEEIPEEIEQQPKGLSLEELPSLEDVLSVFSDELPVFEEEGNLSVFDKLNSVGMEEDLFSDTSKKENSGVIEDIEEDIEINETTTGQERYLDDIQNMSEDEIMNLLQQSSDVIENVNIDDDLTEDEVKGTADLDELLEHMNENDDVAELQDLFTKVENNDPVSSEIEEMIEIGTFGGLAEESVETDIENKSKSGIFSKLKSKLFSKKKKKKKEKESTEIYFEPENNEQENVDVKADTDTETGIDLEALFSFPEELDTTESINLEEGETNLEDLMAETGGLDFVGMQNVSTDSSIFDQLFDDASEVQNDNADVSDISDLLKSLESVEGQSDIFEAGDDLFSSMNSEEGIDTIEGLLEGSEEEPQKEKKPGFFTRLINFLTAEDEEEDSEKKSNGGVEKLGVTSEENEEALAQLDKEGDDGKKKKKKKGKKTDAAEETEEADDDDEQQDDKKKKKKAKKQKKQKKSETVEDTNEPVLSKKKVRSTFLFAFTILAAIMICCVFVPDLFEKRNARDAFYDGNYEFCYQNFYGKKLSESDRLMFEQSSYMLALQRRMDSYNNYMAVGDELRAVESLIQEVAKQGEVTRTAETYGFEAQAEASYQEILATLSEKYHVSEEVALMINGYKQDALFTLHLKAIVAGEEFVCPDYLRENGKTDSDAEKSDSSAIKEIDDKLEDLLPAEEELTEIEFEEGTN